MPNISCGLAATAAGVAVLLLILRMSMQDVPERARRGILCGPCSHSHALE